MDESAVKAAITTFLQERGYPISKLSHTDRLELESLAYVALLLHIERTLHVLTDDARFFEEGLPDSIASICERVMRTSTPQG